MINVFEIKRKLKSKKFCVIGSGTYKNCLTINGSNFNDLVVLEDKEASENYLLQKLKFYLRTKKVNNKLLKNGIKTPRVFRCFKNISYNEVHEKIVGEPVFLIGWNESIAKKLKTMGFKKKSPQYLTKYNELILSKNYESLKNLLDAPSQYYQNFIRDVEFMYNRFGGISLIDNHSENVIYSKNKGFYIIDLNYNLLYKIEKNGKPCAGSKQEKVEICNFVVSPFSCGGISDFIYKDYLKEEDKKLIEEYKKDYNKLIIRLCEELKKYGFQECDIINAMCSFNMHLNFENENFIQVVLNAGKFKER